MVNKITIEYDVITGETTVNWDDMSYAELLGLIEFAKMMVYNNWIEDE